MMAIADNPALLIIDAQKGLAEPSLGLRNNPGAEDNMSAFELGFDVTLVSDATAAFERLGYDGVHYSGEEIHRVNLVSLDCEFCMLRSTAEVLGEIQSKLNWRTTMNKTGGCQCGSIKYELTGTPKMLYICHCKDCQKQSSSAFGMSLRMDPHDITFIQGENRLKTWDTRGDDGGIKRCVFCPDCGTRIIHGSDDPDEVISIKAGSLDDTSWLDPGAHIWLRSAQPWVAIDRDHYRCFDREPEDESALRKRWQSQNPMN